jgi:hypothetical protein
MKTKKLTREQALRRLGWVNTRRGWVLKRKGSPLLKDPNLSAVHTGIGITMACELEDIHS